jgi:hypothetical protein
MNHFGFFELSHKFGRCARVFQQLGWKLASSTPGLLG